VGGVWVALGAFPWLEALWRLIPGVLLGFLMGRWRAEP
jgi:hypothetical protein